MSADKKITPPYLDDPNAQKAFFEGVAWVFGCTPEHARKVFDDVMEEDEAEKKTT